MFFGGRKETPLASVFKKWLKRLSLIIHPFQSYQARDRQLASKKVKTRFSIHPPFTFPFVPPAGLVSILHFVMSHPFLSASTTQSWHGISTLELPKRPASVFLKKVINKASKEAALVNYANCSLIEEKTFLKKKKISSTNSELDFFWVRQNGKNEYALTGPFLSRVTLF